MLHFNHGRIIHFFTNTWYNNIVCKSKSIKFFSFLNKLNIIFFQWSGNRCFHKGKTRRILILNENLSNYLRFLVKTDQILILKKEKVIKLRLSEKLVLENLSNYFCSNKLIELLLFQYTYRITFVQINLSNYFCSNKLIELQLLKKFIRKGNFRL